MVQAVGGFVLTGDWRALQKPCLLLEVLVGVKPRLGLLKGPGPVPFPPSLLTEPILDPNGSHLTGVIGLGEQGGGVRCQRNRPKCC